MGASDEALANFDGDCAEHYRDIARLGDGAEGGTYAAIERATGRRVVLKRVPAAQFRSVRFAFEVLRRAGSPHLPAPRALSTTEDGAGWMVTDWVAGAPLPVARASSVSEALAEARAVAHALAAIHAAGTHHGDVSPSNVIVTPTGGVVLVDLGQLGRLGMGTPGFLAPEVLAGGGGPAADRFALGCLLCVRLLGRVPWQRPEVLVEVRTAAAVAARLDALGEARLDPPVRALLRRLLHPHPGQRIADPQQLVTHLGRLHAAADAGLDLRQAQPWWIPARWPYRGPSLEGIGRALAGSRPPMLVAVAGPAGVGRGRVVEELVQSRQTDPAAPPSRVCEADRLPQVLGRPGRPWLEAWRSTEIPGVVGLLDEPPWPAGLQGDGAIASLAAVLQQIASQAAATLLLPVSSALGRALADRGAAVIEVDPWSEADVDGVLDGVIDAAGRRAWAQRLHAATGGWPARVIRAAEACAEAAIDDPDDASVAEAIARAARDGADSLHPGLARTVMLAVWRGAEALPAVPTHLHDGRRPWATAEAAARRRLGETVASLAAEVADLAERQGEPLRLALAIDADRPAVIEAFIREHDLAEDGGVQEGGEGSEGGDADGCMGGRAGGRDDRTWSHALDRWLDAGGAAYLTASTVAAVMRRRLARGDVEGARRLAPHAPCAAGQLALARALQRLGRIDEALEQAEGAARDSDPTIAWGARGLRWRLWIDQGKGASALARAREVLPEAPSTGLGPATARLWAAMAALVVGEHEQAESWLDASIATAEAEPGRAAAGVRARAHQLHGNLAQARGQLRQAQRRYAEAAEAFEAAGEPVGSVTLQGSLAGLAVLSYDFARGIEHGRAAIGGLLAQGQLPATLEAGLNLVQLWVRVGAESQARALGRLLAQLHGSTDEPRTQARLERVQAELATSRLRPGSGTRGSALRGAQATAESRFVGAAQRLVAAGADLEAAEAWRLAAGLARVQGHRERAQAHLHRARAVAGDDPDAQAELALEAALQDLAAGSPAAVDEALARLSTIGRPEPWCARGRVDLAWSYDRTLLSALRRRLPPSHPARRRVAQRWAATLEIVMKQTGPLDRAAVRGSLLVDGGDPGPLRELLAELEEAPAARVPGSASIPPPAPSTPAPMAGGRPTPSNASGPAAANSEQLLRIYRRLAREERLEVLLQQVVDAMMDLTDAERGAVVVQPTAHTERLEVTRELAEGSEGVRFSRSVIERVLGDGEPVISVDAAADDRFDGSRSISHLNLRSVLAVPLQFRGERLGAAYVDHRLRRGNFDEHDLARMEEFAELAALAVAHARALAELRAQAEAMRHQKAELARLLEAREAEVIGLRDQVRSAAGPGPRGYRGIIGQTPVMQRIFKLIDRVADADVPVVIHGESGTGKELVARALHEAGPRHEGPFIAENCGAIPETLLESVLFGHVKGAFTGASSTKAGLFEAAHRGTIFLDEVGEMSAAMQTKLLRVLQEGELRRVGDSRTRTIDVRVIAASNRDLGAMVERGEFRRDLYYRINVITLELPPLRERIDDLPALIEHFVRRHGSASGSADGSAGAPLSVSAAAMRRLAQHPWPGNVRELENEVQRWMALVEGEVRPEDLSMGPAPADGERGGSLDAPDDDDLQIRPRVERMERALIARAMERTGGNQTKAAALLGLSRYGLQKKLRRLAQAQEEESA